MWGSDGFALTARAERGVGMGKGPMGDLERVLRNPSDTQGGRRWQGAGYVCVTFIVLCLYTMKG